MPTVYKRIFAYCKNNKVSLPCLTTRSAIGRLVAEKWFSQKERPFVYQLEEKQEKNVFKVWYYPPSFVGEIDKIISNYYNLSLTEKTELESAC